MNRVSLRTMLRVLVIILVIVNLVLLSMGLGWLGRGGSGEGDRLARQVSADRIRIVREPSGGGAIPPPASAPAPAVEGADKAALSPSAAAAASAALAAPAPAPAAPKPAPAKPLPQVCRLVPGLPVALADKAAGLLRAFPAVQAEGKEIPASPASFWVHVPPQKNRQAAEARVEELKSKGVQDLFIVQEEGPNRYAVSLGLYRSEKMANDYLSRLKKKGAALAVITARGGDTKRDLSLRGPQDAVEAAIAGLGSGLGGELRTTACP